jgi:hypothetical protein
MTIPNLTDDAVSRLPLEAGRAELLEEIMSTVAPDRPTDEPSVMADRHGRRWLIPMAAAAVVAGIAASSLWGHDARVEPGHGPGKTDPQVATQPAAPTSGFRAVLDAPGWRVTSTESGEGGSGEVNYDQGGGFTKPGGASLTITWYPSDSYDSYVEDREHIVDPPAPGEPVEVLGLGGQLWAYSDDDHTVIREVQAGHWMEFRGTGMGKAAYLALLGQLRLVDLRAFEAALPERFVTDTERGDAVEEILRGIEDVTGTGYPSARQAPPKSDDQDPYHLGAAVAGSYACAWLTEFERATGAGDDARAAEAVRVLGTSRDWPVLDEMNTSGDYPEAVWEYADQVAAGRVPEGYRDGLGC